MDNQRTHDTAQKHKIMKKKHEGTSEAEALHRKAEELLNTRKNVEGNVSATDDERLKLIYELEVHQIELELQNEELLNAQTLAEAASDKYIRLYDMAPSGYFTLSREGKIVELNLTGAQMLGKDRSHLTGLGFGSFVSEDTKPAFALFLENTFKNTFKESCEVILTASGNQPVNIHLSGIATENGRQCMVTGVDITERKLAEKALKASEAKYLKDILLLQSILESPINIVIFSIDKNYCYTRFSLSHKETMKKIWGVDIQSGMNMVDLISDPDDRKKAKMNFDRAFKGDFFVLTEEYGDKKLSRVYYDNYYNPVKDTEGDIVGISVFVVDVTQRKQAEHEIMKLNTRLEITVNKRTEQFKEALGRLEKIADRVPGVVYQYRLNPDGSSCFPFASEGINDIYRVSPEEVAKDASAVFTRLHPDDFDGVVASIQASAKEDRLWQHEYRVKFDDGTVRWLSGNAKPQTEADGTILWHGYISDITEREEVAASLRKSEAEKAAIIRAVPDLMFRIHRDGTLLGAHSRDESMLYSPREMFVGKKVNEVLPPDVAHRAMIAIENVFSTGETEIFEYELAIQGKNCYFEDRIIAISDEEVLSIIRDITEREKLFQELATDKRRLADIIKGTNAGTWEWNIQTGETQFNEIWAEMLGYTLDEISPVSIETWVKFAHPDDLKVSDELLKKHFNGELSYYSFESRMRHKNGDWIWVLDRGKVHEWDKDGKPLLMSGTHQDISDQIRIQEALLKAKIEAEKANQAKSEFLSRMSHELRTPMNSILGFAQLMEMGELKASHKKGVNHILSSGKHLLNLINEVLDISGIEAGRISLSYAPVQVSRIIREAMDTIHPFANTLKVKIEMLNSVQNRLYVKADHHRLRQVLLNLINNAVKYNHAGGAVLIKTELRQAIAPGTAFVRISVSDTGPGINPEDIEKLFMPFERIGAEKTGIEGTGLGLMVVKKLLDAMGGSVGVESVPRVGSTFWIELPHIEDKEIANVPAERESAHQLMVTEKTGTILYIEDNASNTELVGQILLNLRPTIHMVSNSKGTRTVSLAIEHAPDLILLDLDLPDIQGIEVLKLLQAEEKTKGIPVVVVSADAMPQQIDKLMMAGSKDYLTKPLDIRTFLEVVDEWVGSSIQARTAPE